MRRQSCFQKNKKAACAATQTAGPKGQKGRDYYNTRYARKSMETVA